MQVSETSGVAAGFLHREGADYFTLISKSLQTHQMIARFRVLGSCEPQCSPLLKWPHSFQRGKRMCTRNNHSPMCPWSFESHAGTDIHYAVSHLHNNPEKVEITFLCFLHRQRKQKWEIAMPPRGQARPTNLLKLLWNDKPWLITLGLTSLFKRVSLYFSSLVDEVSNRLMVKEMEKVLSLRIRHFFFLIMFSGSLANCFS